MSTFYRWFRRQAERWIWGATFLVVATYATGVYGYAQAEPCASWATTCYQSLQLFSPGGPTNAQHDTFWLSVVRWQERGELVGEG